MPINRDRSVEEQDRENQVNESLQTYVTLEHLEASRHGHPSVAPEHSVREKPNMRPIQQSRLSDRASSPQPEH